MNTLSDGGAASTTPTFRERRPPAPLTVTSSDRHYMNGDHYDGLSISPRQTARSMHAGHPAKQQMQQQQPQQQTQQPAIMSSALASEIIYCLVSAGTTLFNKACLSTFDFSAPSLLLLFQFVLAVALLQVLRMFGVIQLQPLRWETVKLWMPVNLIFVAMNATGFYALQDIGAGMFTVLKNLSNLMTIAGDYVFFGYTYSWQVWGCLFMMILSALLGGWTDAHFSMRGYAWQMVNCLFTAAYSLYLSGVIRKLMRQHGKSQLSELSMVYYNNLLSVPPVLVLSVLTGEPWHLPKAKQLADTNFQLVAVMGGLLGFCVSFASIWCMSRTSATIYSLTGSMNKVVVAFIGMWWFKERASLANLASIVAGLGAGFLFVYAKSAAPGGTNAGPKEEPPDTRQHDEEAPLLPSRSVHLHSFHSGSIDSSAKLTTEGVTFSSGSNRTSKLGNESIAITLGTVGNNVMNGKRELLKVDSSRKG